jgi:hypothetical protein
MHTREADPLGLLFMILFKRLGELESKGVCSGRVSGYRWIDNESFSSIDAARGEHGVVLTLRRWIDAMLRCRSV